MTKIVTAAVLVIGNEILSGRTKDANLGYLATELTAIGVRLTEARVVADVPEAIVKAVNELRAQYDYVFTTGGIGPTHDDITAECVAKAFGVALIKDPRAVRLLTNHYGEANLTEARLRMAHVPEGATLVDNPVSTAPGFQIGNVFVLAGVPAICRAMFDGLEGPAQDRRQGAVRHGLRLCRRGRDRQGPGRIAASAIRSWTSGPIRSSAKASSVPASCCAERRQSCSNPRQRNCGR